MDKIKIIFALDKNKKDVFYVEYKDSKFFTVEPTIDLELVKNTLDCDEEELKYIKSKFDEWKNKCYRED